jgi:hypothetical protein
MRGELQGIDAVILRFTGFWVLGEGSHIGLRPPAVVEQIEAVQLAILAQQALRRLVQLLAVTGTCNWSICSNEHSPSSSNRGSRRSDRELNLRKPYLVVCKPELLGIRERVALQKVLENRLFPDLLEHIFEVVK